MTRLRARWRCHGSVWCCQYVDEPMCNSWNDPHPLARLLYRRRSRREQRREQGWDYRQGSGTEKEEPR